MFESPPELRVDYMFFVGFITDTGTDAEVVALDSKGGKIASQIFEHEE